jgi:glycosyltransferase involved in cell wall biosynthesis
MTATTKAPRVSVVIPAHRASADIAVALDSVFVQTFSDFEVVVVNDGSPDTADLETALEPYSTRVRYIVQANRGADAARNTAIRASHSMYIAFLDADDRWEPEFLQRQVEYLDAHPECDLVYCDAVVSGDTPLAVRRFMETAPSTSDVTLISLIEQRCNIILSTVVARRKTIVAVDLFDETLRRGQDFELWLRLAVHGATIHYQRHVSAERRVRADGLSGDPTAELQRALAVLDRFRSRHDLDRQARTAIRIRMMMLVDRLEIEQGKRRLLEGNFAAARYHFSAPRHQPWKLRIARMALHVAPRLLRAAYLVTRPRSLLTNAATS